MKEYCLLLAKQNIFAMDCLEDRSLLYRQNWFCRQIECIGLLRVSINSSHMGLQCSQRC